MIKRTFSYFSKESLLTLYKSYVRPHLEFCVQAWSPFLKKDIIILEKVQRRATKLLAGITNLSYEERLRILQLTTLEDRRLRGDLIEMYKILNGLDSLNFESLFTRRVYQGLRGHTHMLEVKRCNYNIRKYFFSNRVICMWNSLPNYIVSAPSVNCFKKYYDDYYFGH